MVAKSPPLADADAVEGPQDRVRKRVLLVRAAGEVFGRELLEPVCGSRRRAFELGAFGSREDGRRLEDHAARDDRDALQAAEAVRADRGVEGGGDDPLVFREQVVRELMEVRDAADHGRARDDVIALRRQLCEQLDVLGVTLDQPVARIGVKAALDRPVLAVVVDADHVVARLQQLGD